MNIIKKLGLILSLSIIFLAPGGAGAIDAPAVTPAQADTNKLQDSISLNVSRVTTDKTEYKTGDTIHGSFTLENHSGFAVYNLSYRVQIATNYTEQGAGYKFSDEFLDAGERQDSISLNDQGAQVVQFSYKIPDFIEGDKLGVNIVVNDSSGGAVAFGDSNYFKVVSTGNSLTVKDAEVVLSDGASFDLAAGPTIYEDKEPSSASIKLVLVNPTKNDIAVYPHQTVYEQKNPQAVQSVTPASFTIKAGDTSTVNIPLPNMSYKAGTYFTEVLLNDASGGQLVTRIGARYVVGGNVATVNFVSTDKTSVAAGEDFHFVADISGRPFDVEHYQKGTQDADYSARNALPGKVNVKIFNEKGDVIVASTDTFNVVGETYVDRTFSATAPAAALRLEMSIFDGSGTLITQYNQNLSTDYDSQAAASGLHVDSSDYFNYFIVAGFIMVLLILIFLICRKMISGKAGMMSIFLLFGVLALHPMTASAACDGGDENIRTVIHINAPYNMQHYAPGAPIYSNGFVSYGGCNNSPETLTMSMTGPSGDKQSGVIARRASYNSKNHSQWYANAPFSFGPFKAPLTPGVYAISASAASDLHYGCIIRGYATRYIVVDPSTSGTGITNTGSNVPGGSVHTTTDSSGQTIECTPGVDCPDTDLGKIITKAVVTPSIASSKDNMCPFYWTVGAEDVNQKISCKLIVNGKATDIPKVQPDPVNGMEIPVGQSTLVCTRAGGTSTTTESQVLKCSGNPVIIEH